MEIGDGFSRYDRIKDTAYSCKNHLDRKKHYFNKDMAKSYYIDFLTQKEQNPVVADIVMHQRLKKQPIKSRTDFERNLKELSCFNQIRSLEKKVTQKIAELYPKTAFLREQLIDKERIDLNTVKPKLKGLKKLLLKLKVTI